MDEADLLGRITVNPEIFGGKPIVRGRRLAVEHVLGMLAAGDTPQATRRRSFSKAIHGSNRRTFGPALSTLAGWWATSGLSRSFSRPAREALLRRSLTISAS
jgi:hypothetical protein